MTALRLDTKHVGWWMWTMGYATKYTVFVAEDQREEYSSLITAVLPRGALELAALHLLGSLIAE